jgi:V/A-type H+-transporting ATPase subunit I
MASALLHSMPLAGAVENPAGWLLIVVLGNLFVIVLEKLVVFVQTTRLALFEFFIRFLRAEGRPVRPGSRPRTNGT